MPSIALNLFTNTTSTAPSTDIIRRTIQSFWTAFEPIELRIYIDENPNRGKFQEYYKNLSQLFPEITITKTNSLSDGYVKSINQCKADYLFQLEWDWNFNKHLINHSLSDLCRIMSENNIYHLRFNKRPNTKSGWDTQFTENEFSGVKFCVSNNISNNPHIIDRKRYLQDQINHIKILPGSKGIEEELNATGKYYSAVYGPLNYPATVTHTDGRKLDKRVRFKV